MLPIIICEHTPSPLNNVDNDKRRDIMSIYVSFEKVNIVTGEGVILIMIPIAIKKLYLSIFFSMLNVYF